MRSGWVRMESGSPRAVQTEPWRFGTYEMTLLLKISRFQTKKLPVSSSTLNYSLWQMDRPIGRSSIGTWKTLAKFHDHARAPLPSSTSNFRNCAPITFLPFHRRICAFGTSSRATCLTRSRTQTKRWVIWLWTTATRSCSSRAPKTQPCPFTTNHSTPSI